MVERWTKGLCGWRGAAATKGRKAATKSGKVICRKTENCTSPRTENDFILIYKPLFYNTLTKKKKKRHKSHRTMKNDVNLHFISESKFLLATA